MIASEPRPNRSAIAVTGKAKTIVRATHPNRLDSANAGFRRIGVNRDFAPGRGEEIEETILRLD